MKTEVINPKFNFSFQKLFQLFYLVFSCKNVPKTGNAVEWVLNLSLIFLEAYFFPDKLLLIKTFSVQKNSAGQPSHRKVYLAHKTLPWPHGFKSKKPISRFRAVVLHTVLMAVYSQ